MITHQDTTGTVYSGATSNPAVSGEQVTVYTSTGTKPGTMIGGQIQY
jgi:hypothetical protein